MIRIAYVIAHGLETGNPAAYMFLFMLLCPPVIIIGFAIIEWLKGKGK